MADINSGPTAENAADVKVDGDRANLARADATVESFIELLFFAYRDFTGEPDGILDEFGFGRAHHRVLHFVHRNPGLRVTDLLDILKITKQSLARVLKQLVSDGFILQQPGVADRRERHLYVTNRGRLLAEKLLRLQSQRIGAALAAAGPDAEEVIRRFLVHIISEPDRAAVMELVGLSNRGRPSGVEESGPTPAFKPAK